MGLSWLLLALLQSPFPTRSQAPVYIEQVQPERTNGPQSGDGVSLPGGPWLRDAQNINTQGNQVCARMRMWDNVWDTSCFAVQAGQELANDVGALVPNPSPRLPPGTWIDSARNVRMEGQLLQVELLSDDNLTWVYNAIVIDPRYYYLNNNGMLVLQQASCLSYLPCPFGYVAKINLVSDSLACQSIVCTKYDRDSCCDPQMSCTKITDCEWPLVPNMTDFCTTVKCQGSDTEHCCVQPPPCTSMPRCALGYAFKPNAALINCTQSICDQIVDRDLCCDLRASCSEIPVQERNCPPTDFFNTVDFCGSGRCVPADLGVCCQRAQLCQAGYNCAAHFGYVAKQGQEICQGTICNDARDLNFCCDKAALCQTLTCLEGDFPLPGVYCAATTCSLAADFATCCRRAAQCKTVGSLACGTQYSISTFFDSSSYCDGIFCDPIRDLAWCCKPRALCSTLQCPLGFVSRKGADKLLCLVGTCDAVVDRSACCQTASSCLTLRCPLGYTQNPANTLTSYCAVNPCDPVIDRDLCCKPAQPCNESYVCPLSYCPIPGAFCNGITCNVTRDLLACCQNAMPCTQLPCPRGFTQKITSYCAGPICDFNTDVATCCQPGAAFLYYRFTTLQLRNAFNARNTVLQLSEFYFFFLGVRLDRAGIIAYTINGNNPTKEDPSRSIDDNWDTKWLDFKTSAIIYRWPQLVAIDSFTYVTANDEPDRDPVSFVLHGSQDGNVWVSLSTQTNQSQVIPLARGTETPPYNTTVPCFAPINITNSNDTYWTCVEGPMLADGSTCTASCLPGFTATPSSLTCNAGFLFPWTFTCS